MWLPNDKIIANLTVVGIDFNDDVDVLIGMDIITLGDFALSNFEGKTVFTFRIPSVAEIDYVEENKHFTKDTI